MAEYKKTEEITPRGRPVWFNEETQERFSEISTTVPYGDGWVVMPTVGADGSRYSDDDIMNYVNQSGPIDWMTGEELPIFEDIETANRYAKWRSDTMFDEEAINKGFFSSKSVNMGEEEEKNSMVRAGKDPLQPVAGGTKEEMLAEAAEKNLRTDTFSLPTSANPESDPIVGYEESGEPIRKTFLGTTYSIKTQNTDKDYESEPGTLNRAKEVVKDYATETYEGIKAGVTAPARSFEGELTLGDAMATAGFAATGSIPMSAPAGATRMFGGPRASKPSNLRDIESSFSRENPLGLEFDPEDLYYDPSENLEMIVREVESNPEAYPETITDLKLGGWFRGRDDKLRFEFDDSKSKLTGKEPTRFSKGDIDTLFKGYVYEDSGFKRPSTKDGLKEYTTLEDILDHKELYSTYPELRDLPVFVDGSLGSNTLGYFSPRKGIIAINEKELNNPTELRKTLLHEAQHVLQEIEDFESGTNVDSVEVYEIKKAVEGSPTYKKAIEEYEKDFKEYELTLNSKKKDFAETTAPEIARKLLDFEIERLAKKEKTTPEFIISKLSEYGSLKGYQEAREASYKKLTEKDGWYKGVSEWQEKNPPLYNWRIDEYLDLAESKVYGEKISQINNPDLKGQAEDVYLDKLSRRLRSLRVEPEETQLFEEIFGFTPDKLKLGLGYEGLIRTFSKEKLPPKPFEPFRLDKDTFAIYKRKRGEVEARNVEARADMPASERGPENVFDTEDKTTPPEKQWGKKEIQEIRSGKDFLGKPSKNSLSKNSVGAKYFSEDALKEAKAEEGDKSRYKLVEMDIDSFLDLAEEGISEEKTKKVKEILDSGEGFSSVPSLSFQDMRDGTAKVTGHEGRHRARALKEAGETKMPVLLRSNSIRWGQQEDPTSFDYVSPEKRPRFFVGQEGSKAKEKVPFPEIKGYAEGGEVKSMKEQMNLFQYGGLADDGTDIEPQTGNEVPPGSMSEEVRDDVPTRLSSGEYVVPADVVRFFGVKFFEDLRTEAKSGLMQMDQEDRIGGTPVDNNGMPIQDEELSPEEMAMLQEALSIGQQGMAEGGTVTSPYSTPTSPYSTPTSPYSTSSNPYSMSGGFGIQSREYVNVTTGETRTIQFANGQPLGVIPDGFVPATPEAKRLAEAAKAKSEEVTEENSVFEGPGTPSDAGNESLGFSPETEGGSANIGAQLGVLSLGGTSLTSMIGGAVLGAVTSQQQTAEDPLGQAQESATSGASSMTSNVSPMDVALDAAGLSGDSGNAPSAPTSSGSTAGSPSAGIDGGESPGASGSPSSGSSGSSSGSSDSSGSSGGGTASPGASGVGAPGVAGGEVGAGPGGADAVGPMAKGGLIKRPSKTKKRQPNKRKKPIKGKGRGLGGRK